MITQSLVKLLDEAIIPAVALIVAKMLGLLIAIALLNLPFSLKAGSILWVLPSIQFKSTSAYIAAENYSNLAMFLIAALGSLIVLVRAHFFHESHIHPALHAKLVSLNLESLVVPSYHLYHQALIWLIFLWLTVGLLIVSTLMAITTTQLSIIALVVATNFSWI